MRANDGLLPKPRRFRSYALGTSKWLRSPLRGLGWRGTHEPVSPHPRYRKPAFNTNHPYLLCHVPAIACLPDGSLVRRS
ncbi:hypothetical protein BDU57DRAFT_194458 [Ampelomyces quisqualis]|uniref:Uncharacterized protein n=1 Tax=Ampelomyces quisqualis TaxID=50730 RepID=A0A6A5QWT4_AMPQU|nr:hypothetical protein BDU57DRAFT_194458 [Ampelomyces quisqualis]